MNKKPKKKQETFATIRNRLDKKMSLYIRARDRACVVCGSRENLQNGHYLSRVYFSIRWNPTNCNCQCSSCNVKHELDPEPYRDFMVERYGEAHIKFLSNLAHSGKKMSRAELHEIEITIDREMKGLTNE